MPASNRSAKAIRAAVRNGLGKAEPSDVIRDPAEDPEEVASDAMDLDKGEAFLFQSAFGSNH